MARLMSVSSGTMLNVGSIVIVVDTNVLVESPRLERAEWGSLIEHAADWGVRIILPEVVVMETVNKVKAAWRGTSGELVKLKLGTFDVAHHIEAITSTIADHSESYEDWLRGYCNDKGIDVALPPAVDLMDIARRASEGRAPFKGAKDGFRDTLIWLTVLSIAATADDADVWLVSQNTSDFGATDKAVKSEPEPQYPLHEHLADELKEHGLAGKVRYAAGLKRLEQHIAAQFAPLSDDALSEHTAGIDKEALAAKLVHAVAGLDVEPEAAALPTDVVGAQVIGAREPVNGWRFTEAALRGQAGWTARFSVDVEVDLSLVGAPLVSSEHTKTLRVEGQVSIAPDGSVADLVADSIEALPDDPMRERWIRRSERAASYGSQIPGILGQRDELLRTMASIQQNLQSQPFQDFLRAQQEARAKVVHDAAGITRIAESFRAQQDEIAKNLQGFIGFKAQLDYTVKTFTETLGKQIRPAYEVINDLYKSPVMDTIRSLNLPKQGPLTGLPTPEKKADPEERTDDE